MTNQQALDVAVQYHRSGRLAEAEQLYRQILTTQPGNCDAMHLLGMLAFDCHQYSAAAELVRRAIAMRPGVAEYHHNLGLVLLAQGQLAEAAESFLAALKLNPNQPETHLNLGHALYRQGQLEPATRAYRAALQHMPTSAALCNTLGLTFLNLHQFEDAAAAYRLAIQRKANDPESHSNLGKALRAMGDLPRAIASYRHALKLRSDLAETHNNLANALRQQRELDEALTEYRAAIQLSPQVPQFHTNLGGALCDYGDLEQAVVSMRQAIAIAPADATLHSNLLYTLQFCPDPDEQSIAREHALWNQRHAQPLRDSIQPHSNDRSPDRTLRIGYLGADFKDHCQSCFTLPLLAHHDHSRFVIHCYSNVSRPDAVTQAHQNLADQWRSIFGIPDGQVAQMIRSDQIDILIDLSLHMADNRLLVLAHKPAPIQVSWLGYPASTGLETIDYRLSDPYLDPADQHQNLYPDQVLRLPHSFWCYAPLDGEQPPVNPLPALQNGQLTFGCLNNFCKINPGVLQLWSRLLEEIPNSRLMVLSDPGSHRLRMIQTMVGFGLSDPSRVSFVSKRPRLQYLGLYHQIDLALDSFPYNGHTTSLDGLWMGVPLISLVGTRPVGRGGLSLLSNLGLQELAAQSQQRYIDLARELSGDLPRLAELRSGMRERMKASPLMDAAAFARGMEEALGKMWRSWVKEPG